MTLLADQTAALAPVRAAMMRRAAGRADRILADARSEAAAIVGQARQDAAGAVARGRAAGRAHAAPLRAAELSRGGRQSRTILLNAQRDARDELVARVHAAIAGLRDEPGYDLLLRRLTSLALHAAGPAATVAEHPAGGVVAQAPGVLVDCSLPALARRAIDALGGQLRQLWVQ
jgi:vacuolar-type H+-ATPase subunit E/Vma4